MTDDGQIMVVFWYELKVEFFGLQATVFTWHRLLCHSLVRLVFVATNYYYSTIII